MIRIVNRDFAKHDFQAYDSEIIALHQVGVMCEKAIL
jgi:hypothetical protein